MEKILSPSKITSLSQLDMNGFYTYLDYLSWKFEQRVELIKGKIFPMAAPSSRHQEILLNLASDFKQTFKNISCKVYVAPFDVRLFDNQKPNNQKKNFNTVVQPDICIICDLYKIEIQGCVGAPDLTVEILSAGNSQKEMRTKLRLYEENGVKEYWVVDFIHEQVHQFVLNESSAYNPPIISVGDEMLNCVLFPELKINLVELFAE